MRNWEYTEDIHDNWHIIQGSLGLFGDDMALYTVICCQMGFIAAKGSLCIGWAEEGTSADQRGSVWFF